MMKDKILDVLTIKTNQIIQIKKISGAWDWVEENCESRLLSISKESYKLLDQAKVHTALYPEKKAYCDHGNLRTFNQFTHEFARCKNGRPSQCQCAKDAYDSSDWKVKAEISKLSREATCLSEYGETHVSKVKEFKDARIISWHEKYTPGSDAAADLRNRKVRTFKERHVDDPAGKKKITEKTKQTNLAIRNVEFPGQCPDVKKRIKMSVQKNLNVDNPSKSPVVKQAKIDTSRKNWDTDHPAQSSIIKERTKISIIEKTGRASHTQNHISIESLEILNDPEKLRIFIIENGFNSGADKLNVTLTTIYRYHRNHGLNLASDSSTSSGEEQVKYWLNSLGISSIKDRTICKPKEIDILIPDYNLAIEYDGLVYHSEAGPFGGCNSGYHLDKTTRCKQQGIQLIHIFEDEWIKNKDICKSIIKQKLSISGTKIPARKCVIKELSNKETKQFLMDNHLQGYVYAKINVGLFHDGALVQLMTFGKPRYNKTCQYELLRLASKCDSQIIGGTQKLWAYFVKT